MANDLVTLTLGRDDIGQIIDGLVVRRDSWLKTQKYLDGEQVESVIEDCCDSEEARCIAEKYDEIIKVIRYQIT